MNAAFRAAVKGLGFFEYSRTIFVSRTSGELIHLVRIQKKSSGVQIWLGIFDRESWCQISGTIRPAISGSVSWRGVDQSGWIWSGVERFDLLIERIDYFFRHFRDVADVQKRDPDPVCFERVAIDYENIPLRDFSKVKRFDLETAKSVVREIMSLMLVPSGFRMEIRPGGDFFKRPHGELSLVVKPCLDPWYLCFSLEVFVWSDVIWRAEPRFKGTYFNLLKRGIKVDEVSEICWLGSDLSRDVFIEKCSSELEDCFRRLRSVDTVEGYIANIDNILDLPRRLSSYRKGQAT